MHLRRFLEAQRECWIKRELRVVDTSGLEFRECFFGEGTVRNWICMYCMHRMAVTSDRIGVSVQNIDRRSCAQLLNREHAVVIADMHTHT